MQFITAGDTEEGVKAGAGEGSRVARNNLSVINNHLKRRDQSETWAGTKLWRLKIIGKPKVSLCIIKLTVCTSSCKGQLHSHLILSTTF